MNATGWPTVDSANADQDTAAELYAILMNGALPNGWTSSEVPAAAAGTCQFVLPGGGGGSFTYNGATGAVTVP